MRCPKCRSEFVIEYFPVFTDEMRRNLIIQGHNDEQITYLVEQWENKQSPTGGTCMKCHHDWCIGHTQEEEKSAESGLY